MGAMAVWGLRASLFLSLPVAAGMTLIAFGVRSVPRGMMRLTVLGLFSASVAHILSDRGLHPLSIVIWMLPTVEFALRAMRGTQSAPREQAEIRLLFDHGGVSLCGIWDTGNMLRDPVTSLPVVVVSHRAIRPFLPAGVDPLRYETLPQGFRLISVQTAAGSRLLMCFRPRAIFIRSGRIWRAFHAVVAVSGTLPEDRALLPPSLEA